jgi:5-methylcytosine-specific restriction endonuclease McrA
MWTVTLPQYRGKAWAEIRRYVLERDGWVCQICKGAIDPHARARTPRAPVVDHVIACSAGGAWHDPANLRAAHHSCNSALVNRSRRRQYPLPRQW